MTNGFVTTAEAAARLGVSRRRINALIHGARLAAVKAGRDWLVSVESIEAFRRLSPGRPSVRREAPGGEGNDPTA